MKKTRFALFAAAALALVACVQEVQEEKTDGTPAIGENTLAFTIKSGIATRSEETGAPAVTETGISIPVGETPSGEVLSFEETLTSLDGIIQEVPETRGTPVYSQNFKEVSKGVFNGVAYRVAEMSKNNQPAAQIPDGAFGYDDYFQKWMRTFDNDPWGDQQELLFYARLTKDNSVAATSYGVDANSYIYLYGEAGQQMSFSYRSAPTATEQEDILFAVRKINKSDAQKGSDLLFYHALTGVKFATAQDTEGKVKTFIKKIELSGIYGYGTCYVSSAAETNGYEDDIKDYSSARAIQWDFEVSDAESSKSNKYSQEFSETTVDYAKGGSFGEKGKYADSFAAGGNVKNLNTADGSMTFWLIPQPMTNDVKLTVTYEIEVKGERKEYKQTLDFGKMINEKNGKTITWKAGELRTYTLKAGEVDVEIEDEVHGFEKTDVVITNTGNVDAYIRAMIVANWWGDAGSETVLATGYTSEAHTAFVPIWKRTSLTGDNFGGVFEDLPGTNWVLCTDGYFYYKNAVAPGDATASPLFLKYSLEESAVPEIWYMDGSMKEYDNVFLRMEIPVQAIEAKEGVNWDDAWAGALGDAKKPVPQQ